MRETHDKMERLSDSSDSDEDSSYEQNNTQTTLVQAQPPIVQPQQFLQLDPAQYAHLIADVAQAVQQQFLAQHHNPPPLMVQQGVFVWPQGYPQPQVHPGFNPLAAPVGGQQPNPLAALLAQQGALNLQRQPFQFPVPAEKKVFMVDREVMAGVLNEDAMFRDRRKWPLLPLSAALDLNKRYHAQIDETSLLFDEAYYHRYTPHNVDVDMPTLIQKLCTAYVELPYFLEMGEGHLVAAGGAISRLCDASRVNAMSSSKDLDMFFYGISTDKAEAILERIVKNWMKNDDNRTRSVYRSKFVTTFVDGPRTYQIIHRVYPNKSAVIGGFDLAPSMVLYDGFEILMTPMSVLTFAFGFFFVDVSRRSNNFDNRVIKYTSKGFKPIFSCKTKVEIRKIVTATGLVEDQFTTRIGNYVKMRMEGSRGCSMLVRNASDPNVEIQDYEMASIGYTETSVINLRVITLGIFNLVLSTYDRETQGWKIEADLGSLPEDTMISFACDKIEGRDAHFHFKKWFPDVHCPPSADYTTIRAMIEDRGDQLVERFQTNLRIAEAECGTTVWFGMDNNPGRQRFTSSFNPIEETMSWYNPICKKPLNIGIPFDICCTLQKGRKEANCLFSRMDRGAFTHLMRILRQMYTVHIAEQLLLQ